MRRFTDWLGRDRALALFLLVGFSGAASLVLQAIGPQVAWVIPVQNGLALVAILGVTIIPLSRVDPADRRSLAIAIAPLVAGLGLGLFLPQYMLWFLGAGIAWLAVSAFVLRRGVRREYRQALRHLKQGEYDAALKIITPLIKAEPDNPFHYRFRADLHRLKGRPQQAIQDFNRIIKLEPESAVGYTGLSEIHLQQGDLAQALTFAQQAYARDPQQWAMPYNLGMIEEKMGLVSEAAVHLQEALEARPPDSRHRLLIRLWLARAALKQGQPDAAEAHVAALRKEKRGLEEWQAVFASAQSGALSAILAADVNLARRLFDGAGLAILAGAGSGGSTGEEV